MLVDITEVATGIMVTVEYPYDEGAEFWWSEDGNGGCDCNRELYFRRARGELGPNAFPPVTTCSEGRFTVVLREAP